MQRDVYLEYMPITQDLQAKFDRKKTRLIERERERERERLRLRRG